MTAKSTVYGKSKVLYVSWFAPGVGRRTRKHFRSWSGAVAWWAWLNIRGNPARLSSGDTSVPLWWPRRKIDALMLREARIHREIEQLQNEATRRAAHRKIR